MKYVWVKKLSGVPKDVMWPAKIVCWSSDTDVVVYIKSDHAEMTVKKANICPFDVSLKDKFQSILVGRKRNYTYNAFEADVEWVLGEMVPSEMVPSFEKLFGNVNTMTFEEFSLPLDYISEAGEVRFADQDSIKVNEECNDVGNNVMSEAGKVAISDQDSIIVNEECNNVGNNGITEAGKVAISDQDSIIVNKECNDVGNNVISETDEVEIADQDSMQINEGCNDVGNNVISEAGGVEIADKDSMQINEGCNDVDNNVISEADGVEIADKDSMQINEGCNDVGNNVISEADGVEIADKDSMEINEECNDVGNNVISEAGGVEIADKDSMQINEGCNDVGNNVISEADGVEIADQDSMQINEGCNDVGNNVISEAGGVEIADKDSMQINEGCNDVGNNVISEADGVEIADKDSMEINEECNDVGNNVISEAGGVEIADKDSMQINEGCNDVGNNVISEADGVEIADKDSMEINEERNDVGNNVISEAGEVEIADSISERGSTFMEDVDEDVDYDDDQDTDYKPETIPETETDSENEGSYAKHSSGEKSKKSKNKNKRNTVKNLMGKEQSYSGHVSDSEGELENDTSDIPNFVQFLHNEIEVNSNGEPQTSKPYQRKLREEETVRDENYTKIYIKKYVKSQEGKNGNMKKDDRPYDSVHSCVFCKKLYTHIQDHLENTHHEKEMVKEILNLKGKMKKAEDKRLYKTQIKKLQDCLRFEGDHLHNQNVKECKEGELLIQRKSCPDDHFNVEDYGPCPECLIWIKLQSSVTIHQKNCAKSSGDPRRLSKGDLIVQARYLICEGEASDSLRTEVFSKMIRDETGKCAQTDHLICSLGEMWLSKTFSHKLRRGKDSSFHMRLAAKLLLKCRKKLKKPDLDMKELLSIDNFDSIVEATLLLCERNEHDELKHPSTANKIGFDLARLVVLKYGLCARNKDQDGKEESEEFLKYMKIHWKIKVSTQTNYLLTTRHFDNRRKLPHPKDIEVVATKLSEKLTSLDLTDSTQYAFVAKTALLRLMVYNRRRSGEIEELKMETFQNRRREVDDVEQSLLGELTTTEKYLMESQELMWIRGKRGKRVPVLIPDDTKEALKYITDTEVRRIGGVKKTNGYMFATKGDGVIKASECIRELGNENAGELIHPDRLTSTGYRAYMATIAQCLGLKDHQIQWLCRHLGHTMDVHQTHYRFTLDGIERIQLGKLLMLQDKNLLSRYKDTDLADIEFEEIVASGRKQPQGEDEQPEADETEHVIEDDVEMEMGEIDEPESLALAPAKHQKKSKDFCPSHKSVSLGVSQQHLHDNCTQWIQTCMNDVKSGVSTLLNFVNTVKHLAAIRDTVWELMSQDTSLKDWRVVCERVLSSSLHIWDDLIRPLFVDRVKALIKYQLETTVEITERQMNKVITELDDEHSSRLCADTDLASYIWSESPGDLAAHTAWGLAGSRSLLESGGLMMKAKAYTPIVQTFCKTFDDKMDCISEDYKFYIFTDTETLSIAQETSPFNRFSDSTSLLTFVQTSCLECVQGILEFLTKLMDDCKSKLSGTPQRCTNIGNKLLLSGRLCAAMCDLTPHLQQCMMGSEQISRQDRSVLKRSTSGRHLIGKQESNVMWENIKSQLTRYQHTSFRLWIDHVIEVGLRQLTAAVNAETPADLTATCSRWDEVSIEEETEDGKKITSKISVPMQASWYLMSLLYSLCNDLNNIGGHAVARSVLEHLVCGLSDGIINTYRGVLDQSTKTQEHCLNQQRALQLIFDVKFLRMIIPRKDDSQESKKYQKKVEHVLTKLEEVVDPFDLDVFSPFIQGNLTKVLQRSAVLLGGLTSLDKSGLYGLTTRPAPSSQQEQHNVLMLSTCHSRFSLLPLSVQQSRMGVPQPVISQTLYRGSETSGPTLTETAAAVLPHNVQQKMNSSSFYDRIGSMSDISNWFSNIAHKS